MLFSSPIFLSWFLPLTLMSYYLMPFRRMKNIVLAGASVFFYAWGEPVFVLIMLFSVLISYLAGILIEEGRIAERMRKLLLIFVVIFHLSLFFVFKYWDFFFSNFNALFSGASVPLLQIGLPIGISFFTFQSMSYVFDIYRSSERGAAQKNVVDVLLYISLFPQLIAGPIVRYDDIAVQLTDRKENLSDFSAGIYRFLCGLSKKVLIANNMAIVADLAFNQSPSDLGAMFAWLGAISYFFQIYFDFSAYSDMAIGLGNVFGFHFLENFNYPYVSSSMTESWRRWHISLGNWFRDYVYIPLGGNRGGRWLTFRNLLVVWILTGFWHGADWTFVVWGLYHFLFLIFEKEFIRRIPRIKSFFGSKILPRLYVVTVFTIGWVIFRSPSIQYAFEYISEMFFGGSSAIPGTAWFYLREYLVFYIPAILLSAPIIPRLEAHRPPGFYFFFRNVFVAVASYLSVVYLIKGVYNPFIYFNF